MIQRPQFISDQEIITQIRNSYGIHILELEFIPVGEASWCFKATSDKGDLFIKLTKNGLYEPSVEVPSYMRNTLNLPFTIPVVPMNNERLWDIVNDHDLVVYPYIKGSTSMHHSLQDIQWEEIGKIFQKP